MSERTPELDRRPSFACYFILRLTAVVTAVVAVQIFGPWGLIACVALGIGLADLELYLERRL